VLGRERLEADVSARQGDGIDLHKMFGESGLEKVDKGVEVVEAIEVRRSR
jgi:hypothetical protein